MTGWPSLAYDDWRATRDALHLRTQILGKIRLALAPWLNHSWHAPLTLTSRGLGTGVMHAPEQTWSVELDLVEPAVRVEDSDGRRRVLPLGPGSIADAYRDLVAAFADGGVALALHPVPNELVDPIAFTDDVAQRPFDADAARRFWRVLLRSARALERYRARFVGKASPIHFFWGSFDLAHSRFSGRTAPPHPGGIPHLPDWVAREAYSHEVVSIGFWPGDERWPHAAYYGYAYPAPDGFARPLGVDGAFFHPDLREHLLPYDAVRASADPEAALLRFAEAVYARGADGLAWDRAELDRDPAHLAQDFAAAR